MYRKINLNGTQSESKIGNKLVIETRYKVFLNHLMWILI